MIHARVFGSRALLFTCAHNVKTIHGYSLDTRAMGPRCWRWLAHRRGNRRFGQGCGNRMAQDIWGHGFAHEIRSTKFHGFHGELDGGKGCHHDHACSWSTLPETTERFNTIDTRHLLVQQHDVPDGV